MGGAGGAAGYGIGRGIGAVADSIASKSAAKGSQRALIDANTQAVRDAGYVLPISQTNPSSVLANTADIIAGGRPTMAQAASIKNQPVTNNLAAKALGLPMDEPITKASLSTLRNQAAQAGYHARTSVCRYSRRYCQAVSAGCKSFSECKAESDHCRNGVAKISVV